MEGPHHAWKGRITEGPHYGHSHHRVPGQQVRQGLQPYSSGTGTQGGPLQHADLPVYTERVLQPAPQVCCHLSPVH